MANDEWDWEEPIDDEEGSLPCYLTLNDLMNIENDIRKYGYSEKGDMVGYDGSKMGS